MTRRVGGTLGHLVHLARRFVGSLDPRGPSRTDEQWAKQQLLEGEAELWTLMSGPDRRHAVGVGREVARQLGPHAAPRAVVAAALLHDVGKLDSRLGTFGRVAVTAAALVAGRERIVARRPAGRAARYLRHDELGAGLLRSAGSDALTVSWAREHHLSPSRWTIDARVAGVLKAADGD